MIRICCEVTICTQPEACARDAPIGVMFCTPNMQASRLRSAPRKNRRTAALRSRRQAHRNTEIMPFCSAGRHLSMFDCSPHMTELPSLNTTSNTLPAIISIEGNYRCSMQGLTRPASLGRNGTIRCTVRSVASGRGGQDARRSEIHACSATAAQANKPPAHTHSHG